jgi:hypothetical protein
MQGYQSVVVWLGISYDELAALHLVSVFGKFMYFEAIFLL